jgi:hypothetical protein
MPPRNYRKAAGKVLPIVVDEADSLDPPAARDPSELRRAKLDELHGRYIENPPTAREERQAEQSYVRALALKEAHEQEMKARLAEQKRVGAKRKALEKKHEELYAKMNAELEEVAKEARAAYQKILDTSKKAPAVTAEIDKASERVVLTHGRGPIVIEGVTYDVGCYEERVYLVRRHVQKARGSRLEARGPKRGAARPGAKVREGKR